MHFLKSLIAYIYNKKTQATLNKNWNFKFISIFDIQGFFSLKILNKNWKIFWIFFKNSILD
jgi:hypothetical protein